VQAKIATTCGRFRDEPLLCLFSVLVFVRFRLDLYACVLFLQTLFTLSFVDLCTIDGNVPPPPKNSGGGGMYKVAPQKAQAESEVDDLLADLGLGNPAPAASGGGGGGGGGGGRVSSGPGGGAAARGGMSSGPGARGGMSSGPGARGGMSSGPGARGGTSSGPGRAAGMSAGPGRAAAGRGAGAVAPGGRGAGRGQQLATHTPDGREIVRTRASFVFVSLSKNASYYFCQL
jgi:hypothetical protein